MEFPEEYLDWYEETPSSIDLASKATEVFDKSSISRLEKWLTRMIHEQGRPEIKSAFFRFNRKTTHFSAMGRVMFAVDRRCDALHGATALCIMLLSFLGRVRSDKYKLSDFVLIDLYSFAVLEAVFGIGVARRVGIYVEEFDRIRIADLTGPFCGWIVLAVLERKGLFGQISLNSSCEEIGNLIEQIKNEEIEFNDYLLLHPRIVEHLTSLILQHHERNRV